MMRFNFVRRLMRGWGRYLVLALLGFGFCVWLAVPSTATIPVVAKQERLEQAQQFYRSGEWSEAAKILEQVFQSTSDVREQIIAGRNLALVYQHLGEWQKADRTIATCFELLKRIDDTSLLASVLDVQGSLQLEQGQTEAAVESWQRSRQLYEQLGNSEKAIATQINQAQALQRLGFYRRSRDLLSAIVQTLEGQPDSLSKAVSLRSLGDGLQFLGDSEQARKRLEASLEIAQRLQEPTAIANAQLSLGNLLRLTQTRAALERYTQAAASSPTVRVQAQLNQLSLYITEGQTKEAQALWPQIQADLDNLPPSHSSVMARINLANSLIELDGVSPQTIAQILTSAIAQARQLGDLKLESDAIGTLSHLYERSKQWDDARKLSEQALLLAQTNNAPEITYRWQWQLGRIFASQNEYETAIDYYSETLRTLQRIRTDLVAVNAQAQISFQESVDPIHREFISLLLDPKRGATSPQDLEKALQAIESLQLAELDNFFREACLNATPIKIDRIDPQAAVIYPIVLKDRLEVIISLPNQQLRHYTSAVGQAELEKITTQLRQFLLIKSGKLYLANLQQLYRWLVQPIESELTASQIKNLVFVLNGSLRNLPMSALHDGRQFLVEKYGVALTPGLQLLNPQPLQAQNMRAFIAGLSESRQGFSSLPYVSEEVKQIEATIPSQVLLNQKFTEKSFKEALSLQSVPIVHVATHGQFSSLNENTFILTWDERLNITTLNSILQVSDLDRAIPIELLVLSACETAVGDRQAALGLAGMAVRAGARSTLATLWQVDDEATALLMNRFYEKLTQDKTTKAEALRQAQIAILQDSRFKGHPYYWAPFVLVGNWL